MANQPGSKAIRAAYHQLGLQPGVATKADARRAYRRLLREVHPEHHPDDPQAEAKTGRLDAAVNIVEEHIKRGGRLSDEKRGSAPRAAGPVTTIHEVKAPAGAGKTTRWAAAMASTDEMIRRGGLYWPPERPQRVLYAGPTIALLREVESALAKVGVKATAIHSESGGTGLVNKKLSKFFSEIDDADDAVVLITHTALLDLPHTLTKPTKDDHPPEIVFDRSDWDLVIDEAPEILTFYAEAWPLTHRLFSDRLEAVEFSEHLYQLVPQAERSDTFFRMLGAGIPHDTNIGEGAREIAKAVINPARLVLVSKDQWDDLAWRNGNRSMPFQNMLYGGALDVMVLHTPASVNGYRSTSIMGARLDSTLYHVLWSKLFNMQFRKHPLQDQLAATHTNGRRLRLWYMVDEPATREMLVRQSDQGDTMFRSFAAQVSEFFNPKSGPKRRNRQFIWSAPLDRGSVYGVRDTFFRDIRARTKLTSTSRPGERPFDPDLRLSGKAMGQNRYLKYHNAVLLNVVNFSPNQWVMLHHIGLTDAEIYRSLAHNVAYQDLARCSIRETKVRDVVNAIVIDKGTATDIGGEFPGCQIKQVPNAPHRAMPKRVGRKKDATDSRTDAEKTRDRQRRWRAKQRSAKEIAKQRSAEG